MTLATSDQITISQRPRNIPHQTPGMYTTPTASTTLDLNLPFPKTENLQPKTLADFCDPPLAPLSLLRPIFSDILFTSLAAEADGAKLVGLTVQLDLPELGLTREAILADIQTTPEVEQPLDSRDERQVVTATFHHSSGDVIDLVVADSLGERLGVSPHRTTHLVWIGFIVCTDYGEYRAIDS